MSDSHSDSAKCPRCGAFLPTDAPEGLCPRCLAALHLGPETAFTGESTPGVQPPLPPEKLAEHFPQFEILECLGRGGMGVVYKARQKSLNRLVALKLLAPERAQDAAFAERFTREAQALAALNHPHIVTVYDFGQAGGFYYLLMEFVDGVNLRQAMNAKRFTPEQALAVVPPVCEALQYAHEHHIVHRDIKPENLLLDKEGRVKIADFGIAKMLGEETTTGLAESQPAGTPQYMAPEQKDHQRTDHRADIYSLGVVLYEMLTGELPANKLQPPSRKVSIDVRLDEIVLRALEKTPELRYQTAGDFRTQVETLASPPNVADAPAPEVPPSVAVPAWLFVVLYCGLLWFEVRSAAWMPPNGATHFDINGKPNGWMHRSSFLAATTLLPLFYVTLFWLISRATGRFPYIFNIPRRDYWLAPERKAFAQALILRWLLWLACVLTVFFGGLHALVLQANRVQPPHMPQGPTLGLLLTFLLAVMIWLGSFLFRLAEADHRRPVPENSAAALLSRQSRRLLRATLIALPVALVIRTFFLQPFAISGNGASPEIPEGSHVAVWKLGSTFVPGDLLTYRHGKEAYVGRVVRCTEAEVTVNRNGQPDDVIPRDRVIGKVVSVYWRGTMPTTPPVIRGSPSPQATVTPGDKNAAIGVALKEKQGRIYIAQIVPNTPASDGRLHVGDEVLNFGPKKDLMMLARGMSVGDCVKYMRGEVGSPIFLRIVPAGESEDQPKLLEYTRQLIPVLEAGRLGQLGSPKSALVEGMPAPRETLLKRFTFDDPLISSDIAICTDAKGNRAWLLSGKVREILTRELDQMLKKHGEQDLSVIAQRAHIQARADLVLQPRVVRLEEVVNPDMEDCTVLYRAKLMTKNLEGRAFLEMWCRFPGSGEYFSRSLNQPVSGSTDWVSCQAPFILKKGEKPDLIRLNVVIEGEGEVYAKDIELSAVTSNPPTASSGDENFSEVGVVLVDEDRHTVVSFIFPNSAAAKDGRLKQGDIVYRIGEGEEPWTVAETVAALSSGTKPEWDLDEWKLKAAGDALRGAEGTKVSLFVVPAGKTITEGYKLTLTRGHLPQLLQAEIIRLAQERLEEIRAHHSAGDATMVEVVEAEGELTLAEALGDPLKEAEARLATAAKALPLVETLYQAGQATDLEVKRAKQRKLEAEFALQRLRNAPPAPGASTLVFTGASIVAAPSPKEGVELKQRWIAGKKYCWTVQATDSNVMAVGGNKINQAMTMTEEVSQAVRAREDGQGKRMTLKYERMAGDITMGGQKFASFDSNKPDQGNDPFAKTFAGIVGKDLQLLLGENDEIVGFENYDEFIKNLGPSPMRGMDVLKRFSKETIATGVKRVGLQAIPDHPVKPGESWPYSTDLDMPPAGKLVTAGRYTFKGMVKYDGILCAEIEAEAKISMDPNAANSSPQAQQVASLGAKVEGGSLKGTLWFDPQLGYVRASHFTQEMTMTMKDPSGAGGASTISSKGDSDAKLTKVEDLP